MNGRLDSGAEVSGCFYFMFVLAGKKLQSNFLLWQLSLVHITVKLHSSYTHFRERFGLACFSQCNVMGDV